MRLVGQKTLAKAANGAIFGATVGAKGGLSPVTLRVPTRPQASSAAPWEKAADGDTQTVVLDKKAATADVFTGAATGLIGETVKEPVKGVFAAGPTQATTRAGSLLEQTVRSGDVAKIAKREAQPQAVKNSINKHAVGAAALQRTATMTAVRAVLKPKQEQ